MRKEHEGNAREQPREAYSIEKHLLDSLIKTSQANSCSFPIAWLQSNSLPGQKRELVPHARKRNWSLNRFRTAYKAPAEAERFTETTGDRKGEQASNCHYGNGLTLAPWLGTIF